MKNIKNSAIDSRSWCQSMGGASHQGVDVWLGPTVINRGPIYFLKSFINEVEVKFKLECSSASNTQNEDVVVPLKVKNEPRGEKEQTPPTQVMQPRCVEPLITSITERKEKLKKIDDIVSKHEDEITNVIK